eukprot:469130_1
MDSQTTTQSKYRKKRKDESQPSIEANEVRIKGNQGHVKRYVDYACGLLEGDQRRRQQQQRQQQQKEKEKEKDDADKDETNKDDADSKQDEKEEPKIFDTIVLKATGRAINKAVTTAEVVKRRVPGLHQVTSLETLEITDVWEPLEQGLKEVETKRRVASITITLSRAEDEIDKNASGYQQPISADAIKPFSNFNNRRRGGWNRNRGYRRGGYRGGWNRNRGYGGYGGYNNRGGYRGGWNRNRGYGGGGYNNRGGGYRRGGYGGYNNQNRSGSPGRSPYNRRGGYGGGRGRGGYGGRGGGGG